MKKLLVMILFILLLTGCGKSTDSQYSQEVNSQKTGMFVCIQPANFERDYSIVYQRDTKVMYAVSHGYYNSGNFTLLVNSDGTPMLYEGE
jgi:hypothetical protein